MNISDIARATGVSTATVSRVLNHSGYVKGETREKIEAYIEKSNYVPSGVARNLSKKATSSIGVIVPDIENPFFSSLIHGIGEEAESRGLTMVLFGTNEDPRLESRVLYTALEQRLCGVIIAPVSAQARTSSQLLTKLERSGVPVVLVDRDIRGTAFDGVFVDNRRGTEEAVEALLQVGHRRIATIAGPDTSRPGRERLEAFRHTLALHGVPLPEHYVEQGEFRLEPAYAAVRRLLTLPEPPTALFSANNMMTLGCLKFLREQHLKLGRDIALIGFDEIETLALVDYGLSVVTRDVNGLGRETMRVLVSRLGGEAPDRKPRQYILPVELLLRGSEKMVFSRL